MDASKIRAFIFIFCLLIPVGLRAEGKAPLWQLEAKESRLSFTAIVNGGKSGGDFTDFDAVIHFDPDNLAASSVEVEIRLKGIRASYAEVESSLKEKDWFDVAAFPVARYTSHAIKKVGKDVFRAMGTLSLKGVDREIPLDFTFEEFNKKTAVMKGHATLKRLDFNVGAGAWKNTTIVKNDIRLDMVIKAVRPEK